MFSSKVYKWLYENWTSIQEKCNFSLTHEKAPPQQTVDSFYKSNYLEHKQFSVLCELHFKERFINFTPRCNFNWQLLFPLFIRQSYSNPIPLPIPSTKKRATYSENTSGKWDEKFDQDIDLDQHIISAFDDLNQNHVSSEFIFSINRQ